MNIEMSIRGSTLPSSHDCGEWLLAGRASTARAFRCCHSVWKWLLLSRFVSSCFSSMFWSHKSTWGFWIAVMEQHYLHKIKWHFPILHIYYSVCRSRPAPDEAAFFPRFWVITSTYWIENTLTETPDNFAAIPVHTLVLMGVPVHIAFPRMAVALLVWTSLL